MKREAKERISSYQLFSLLFVSRLSALMISGEVTLMSFFVQFILSVSLCALAYFAAIKVKNTDALVYTLCIILSVATIYSLADFKEKAVVENISDVLSLMSVIGAVLYTSSLGIQASARFAGMSAIILVTALSAGILSNVKQISAISISSCLRFGISPVNIIKCVDIPAIFLKLHNNTNGNIKRPLFYSVAASYGLCAAVWAVCALTLRDAAALYAYPVFTLFQLGQFGSYNKLDILFTSPMLIAVFLKLSIFFQKVKK